MRYNVKFDFVEHRNKFFMFSILITVIGCMTLGLLGFNYGVDFKAGTSLDITIGQSITQDEAMNILTESGFAPPSAPTIGGDNNERISARYDIVLDITQIEKITQAFVAKYGEQVSREVNTVDPAIARELAVKAIYAVMWASVGIIIYVSIRFEWRFAIAAIIALLHDAFIVIGLFSIFRLEVNLPFVAAILTIIGYSINDTIVIFDRIRENLRFAKLKNASDLARVVNESIWQTLTRSINTVMTVLFTAICLFIFGSPALQLFSLAIIFGLICGAYSSIFIASQLWYIMKKTSIGKVKKVNS